MMRNSGFKSLLTGYKKHSSAGFTLIETVIALAILGIGLTVIIEDFSGGLRLARTSEEYTKAMNYARMKLRRLSPNRRLKKGRTKESTMTRIVGR